MDSLMKVPSAECRKGLEKICLKAYGSSSVLVAGGSQYYTDLKRGVGTRYDPWEELWGRAPKRGFHIKQAPYCLLSSALPLLCVPPIRPPTCQPVGQELGQWGSVSANCACVSLASAGGCWHFIHSPRHTVEERRLPSSCEEERDHGASQPLVTSNGV